MRPWPPAGSRCASEVSPRSRGEHRGGSRGASSDWSGPTVPASRRSSPCCRGCCDPTTGRVHLRGEDVTDTSAGRGPPAGLARTFQQPELFLGLTVREHLIAGPPGPGRSAPPVARHARSAVALPPSKARTSGWTSCSELLKLTRVAKAPVSALPLGILRLVELGRALASEPRVLLLDEPLSGLDIKASENLLIGLPADRRSADHAGLAHHRGARRGRGPGAVGHRVRARLRRAHRVGSPEEIRNDPAVRAAYLGDDEPNSKRVARRAGPGRRDSA
jgi:ABC-type branched-subunit amino acid transport system ATPase component